MEKLNRVFDQATLSREREDALLADLLSGKKEVSNMKQTSGRRRIPAAALLAAALAVVLAGTALASGYFGRASVVPGKDAYTVYGAYHYIPEENLPEGVRALGEDIADYGDAARPFASRAECEEFLGLTLAANPKLEELPRVNALDWSNVDPNWGEDLASSGVMIFFLGHEAKTIDVTSLYGGDDYQVTETAIIRTDKCGIQNGGETMRMGLADAWTIAYEDYTTPCGLEASIAISTQENGNIFLNAYFAIDNALYKLDYMTLEEYHNMEDSMQALKEILDAYE